MFFRKQLHIAAVNGRIRGLPVVIDLPHGIFSQQDVHTADVIGMGMCEDDFINSSALFNACLCQLCTKLIAFIHVRRVDEDILRPRLHEDRVALPDLKHPNDKRSLCRAYLSRTVRRRCRAESLHKELCEHKYDDCRKSKPEMFPERFFHERSAKLIRNAIETRYMIQLTFLYCPAKSFMTV